MLKCSKCRHIFPAPSSKKQPPPASSAAPKPDQRDELNLTLPFDEPAWKDESEVPPAHSFDESEPDEEFVLGTEERDEDPDREAPAVAEPPPARRSAPASPVEDDGAAETSDPRPRRAPRRKASKGERSPVRPLFMFLAAVVAAYGLLTRALFASPALCDKL